VRDSDRFSIPGWGWAIVLALAIKPLFELTRVLPRELWVLSTWMLCCVAGAIPAAFAIRHQNREKLMRALPSFVAAIILGYAAVAASALSRSGYTLLAWRHAGFFAGQFILYFTVCFVLEEVAFRGAIDAHIYQPNDSNKKQLVAWVSAIFVSILWGIWHLPLLGISDASTLISVAPGLIFAHVIIGVPLSFCWRTSGTLLLPTIAHALIDAYRTTVLF
jgi:membrane protease YdiL (CAAX protease family)